MNKKIRNGLQLWEFENLSKHQQLHHFVTGRDTEPGKDFFTLSLSSSPEKDHVYENRRKLAQAIGVSFDKLFFPSQVHDTRIVRVSSSTTREALQHTDALITNETGMCIAVMSADCVPILLFDTRNAAVAAIHSGWRGTVARILEKTLLTMADEFGTEGKDVIAGIGPSVSQEAYEVGHEVIDAVKSSFSQEANQLLIEQDNGKARLDLWKANRIQLINFGVQPENIEIANLCTVRNNDYFFSARKGDAGRFAAGIMLT